MPPTAETLREPVRNALLRRVDWRFLLGQPERPRTLDLSSGRRSRAVRLVSEPVDSTTPHMASLAVLARASRRELKKARTALRPGGEVYCELRVPMIAGPWRARRRLVRGGFTNVQIYWPWPPPRRRTPQFWLPLDSPAALHQFLALRPARSRSQAVTRRLWWVAVRAGLLAPLCVIARRCDEGGDAPAPRDELEALLPSTGSWALLTGGRSSINKVVGLPLTTSDPIPLVIVKFARVPEAEPGLEREAEVLRTLEAERPRVSGIPRVVALTRRAGLLAVAETAIHGQPLLSQLTPATFPELAGRVTHWLVNFANIERRQPRAAWWPRLVEGPLDEFERAFGAVGGIPTSGQARALLDGLEDLPHACEHRDCAPWNIVLNDDGSPALLDWESAELSGLPGLDLIYFLANAAFILDGALESRRTRETYARVLDPSTPLGRVAAACLAEYREALEIDTQTLARLRLLCWIVHSQSEYRRLEMDAGGTPDPAALRKSVFLGLIHHELHLQH